MPRTKKQNSIDGPIKPKGKSEISLIDDDGEFVVHQIEEEDPSEERMHKPLEDSPQVLTHEPETVKKVVVSFNNFVNLVANHNYEEVVEKNKDEEVIVSSDLLAALANAHEQEEERRIPAIFIIGVVLGIVITYILLTF